MLRAYKYRLYPTKDQIVLIEKHFGCARFIYNLALECKMLAYSGTKTNLSGYDLMKQLKPLKEDLPWLKEVAHQTIESAINNLDCAYKNYFTGKSRFPKFKSKRGTQSFHARQYSKVINGKLFISKFNSGIEIVLHRPIEGNLRTVTISKTPTGKYFASILVDSKKEPIVSAPIDKNRSIGIDLGIKSFLVTSNGFTVDNPRHLKKSLMHLKYLQRRVSKKVKGSGCQKKAAMILARQHEKVANQRKDFLQKLSSKIISENQTICIEDLSSSNMIKNHKLAQAISDVGWGMFVSMLEYKANWYGKNLLKIGRFEPSSKMCSDCGAKNDTLTLSDREWVCANCGVLHDRDLNAAKNIKEIAFKNLSTGSTRKNLMELPELYGAVKSVAHTAQAAFKDQGK